MNNIKPVAPHELVYATEHAIHPSMIRAINILLTRFNGSYLTIKECEIVEKFLELEPDFTRDEVYDKHYLDFEGLYKREGWKISYDKPDYTENHYEPYFTFSV